MQHGNNAFLGHFLLSFLLWDIRTLLPGTWMPLANLHPFLLTLVWLLPVLVASWIFPFSVGVPENQTGHHLH